ncbi:hypothetical protein [Salinivibrio costicola]|uniref:hypothetical protein n=1 Tax=Salinivibrio costicola TaxID=51367 RepID=UPI000AB12FB4|nr:hypothetical protein [Salinivibrio costicola]
MISTIVPRRFTRVLTHWRGKLLPLQCPVCHLALPAHHSLCCDACWDAHHQCLLCQCCGLPVSQPQARCGACLSQPPAWDRLVAISGYHDPLPQLIHAFKYQGAFELALPFAQQLSDRILTPAPVLLPVPLHWRRRWQRGFNQSLHLAWALADNLDTRVVDTYLSRRPTLPRHNKVSVGKTGYIICVVLLLFMARSPLLMSPSSTMSSPPDKRYRNYVDYCAKPVQKRSMFTVWPVPIYPSGKRATPAHKVATWFEGDSQSKPEYTV